MEKILTNIQWILVVISLQITIATLAWVFRKKP